jgi:catechol 2,3-dioxygenase-like lactoylglutathione lyase family enzyme
MNVSKLDHLVLTVKSIDKTCDFYSQILGMKVVRFDEGRTALHFGEQKINLHKQGKEFEPKAKSPMSGSGDFCLITDVPIVEVIDHFNNCGIPVEVGPVQKTGAVGKLTSVYVRDPDENLIEIANMSF